MKQKAIGLNPTGPIEQSRLGGMSSNIGVTASPVAQGDQVFAKKSIWADLAEGVAGLTQGVAALEQAQQAAVAKAAHEAEAERKRKEAEDKKRQEDEDTLRAQGDVARAAVEGRSLTDLVPESGASPAYQTSFRKTQAGIVETQLKEKYQQDHNEFFSDPKRALTKSPEQFDRDWARENGIQELTKDPYMAGAAVGVLFGRDKAERHARAKAKQDELRRTQGEEAWRNDMFSKVGTTKETPDLWEHEEKAKGLNIPEGRRYQSMMDGVTAAVSSGNLFAYHSLDSKGPENLSMRQVILRSGDNAAISALNQADKAFNEYNKKGKEKADEDALKMRMSNWSDRRDNRVQEFFNPDGTLNESMLREPLNDPGLTSKEALAEYEQNKKAAQKAMETRLNGDLVSSGNSVAGGVSPTKVMTVVNEKINREMEQLRQSKGLPVGSYDMTGLAATLLAYSTKEKEPSYLKYGPWTKIVDTAAGTTPTVYNEETGKFTLTPSWQPVVTNLSNIWNASTDKATARANILKVTGNSEMTDMVVSALEVANDSVSFEEVLGNIHKERFSADNLKGTGPKLKPLDEKDLKKARSQLQSAAPGLGSRFASSIGVGGPSDAYQGATADLVIARATQRWYESNARAIKPEPFDVFFSKYVEKEMKSEFVYDGANYVPLPPDYKGTIDEATRGHIETGLATIRRRVTAKLKKADMEFSSVVLVPRKEGSSWYEVMVDGKPAGFEPIALGDVKRTRTVDGKTISTTEHGLLKKYVQEMAAVPQAVGDDIRDGRLAVEFIARIAGQKRLADAALDRLEKDTQAMVLKKQVMRQEYRPVIEKMKLPAGLAATVSVGDSAAVIRDAAYNNPQLAIALTLEGGKTRDGHPGLFFSHRDNDGGVTLPLGINMKHQDEAEIRGHLRAIGFADKEAQDRILNGQTGLTQTQSIELYQRVVPRYQKEAAGLVEKMTGHSWSHFTPNQQAAITQAHYNGVGKLFIQSVLVDKDPDAFQVYYTENGKKVRNSRMENGIKAMYVSPAELLSMTGQLPKVDVSSPSRMGGALSLPPLAATPDAPLKSREANGKKQVQLPDGQWVDAPTGKTVIPPMPKR